MPATPSYYHSALVFAHSPGFIHRPTSIPTYIPTYLHTSIHIYIPLHTHLIYIHTCLHTNIHTYILAHLHTYVCFSHKELEIEVDAILLRKPDTHLREKLWSQNMFVNIFFCFCFFVWFFLFWSERRTHHVETFFWEFPVGLVHTITVLFAGMLVCLTWHQKRGGCQSSFVSYWCLLDVTNRIGKRGVALFPRPSIWSQEC